MFAKKILKLMRIVSDAFFLKALLKGTAAGTEHLSVFKNFDFQFIVDVGANRGQFALIARKLYPNAVIHSFEPLLEPAETFRTVFKSDSGIHLHQCAIGSDNKEMVIHVSERDDSSSLLQIGENQSSLFPHTEESETRKTQVFQLNKVISPDEIQSKALLKIDVQGFELEVLKGCVSELEKFHVIYVECSFVELYEGQALVDEVINFLQANQFALSGVYNLHHDHSGRAIQADFLFLKNK